MSGPSKSLPGRARFGTAQFSESSSLQGASSSPGSLLGSRASRKLTITQHCSGQIDTGHSRHLKVSQEKIDVALVILGYGKGNLILVSRRSVRLGLCNLPMEPCCALCQLRLTVRRDRETKRYARELTAFRSRRVVPAVPFPRLSKLPRQIVVLCNFSNNPGNVI